MQNRTSKLLDADLDDEELERQLDAQPESLFRRGTLVQAGWNDFEMVSIIGRGTFGKVYLARFGEGDGEDEHYAIKTIRKDILLEEDKIENTMMEKTILLELKKNERRPVSHIHES